MNNPSNERLKQHIDNPLDNGLSRAEVMEVIRELLTLREAGKEPVAWLWRWSDDAEGYWRYSEERIEASGSAKVKPLYAAPQLPAVPDGWVMVPITPTAEMRMNGIEAATNAMQLIEECPTRHCWRAMIAAAPKPE